MTKYEVTIYWKDKNPESVPMITGINVAEGCILLTSQIEGAPYFSKIVPQHAVTSVDVSEQVYRS